MEIERRARVSRAKWTPRFACCSYTTHEPKFCPDTLTIRLVKCCRLFQLPVIVKLHEPFGVLGHTVTVTVFFTLCPEARVTGFALNERMGP